MTAYDLYRYRHPDGTGKDWAIRTVSGGEIETRWGKTGTPLVNSKVRKAVAADLIRRKTGKGYTHVGQVEITTNGLVQPKDDAPNDSPAVMEQIYWRIQVQAVELDVLAQWAANLSANIAQLVQLIGLDFADGPSRFHPGIIAGWAVPTCGDSRAGKILKEHGVVPLLVLMRMKATAPDGVRVSLATEDSIEIGVDPRKETKVLAFYGTDIESVRPLAEALELLQARINLAEAIQSGEDFWL
jgi:hypothetical protein